MPHARQPAVSARGAVPNKDRTSEERREGRPEGAPLPSTSYPANDEAASRVLSDLLGAVRRRERPQLVAGGGQVHASVEHVVEEPCVALVVGGPRLRVVPHRSLAEEHAEQRLGPVDRHRDARRLERPRESGRELLGRADEPGIGIPRASEVERRDPRRDRDRVPAERPRLVYGADRCELLHQFLLAAERGAREAAAHHLAERGEIGVDAVHALRAAVRDAEARDDLVEEQERAVLQGDLAQSLEESVGRGHDAHVRGDGLDGDERDLAPALGEHRTNRAEVVVRDRQRVLRGRPRSRRASRGCRTSRARIRHPSRGANPSARGSTPRTSTRHHDPSRRERDARRSWRPRSRSRPAAPSRRSAPHPRSAARARPRARSARRTTSRAAPPRSPPRRSRGTRARRASRPTTARSRCTCCRRRR